MTGITKKFVAAVAVSAFVMLGAAAPVNAASAPQQARTVWCC